MANSLQDTPRWRSINTLIKTLRKLIAALLDLLHLVDALAT
ncbi:hypothetical protein [Agromyces cerinus]|uniref:Uncharacterized protein n=1 Tax=Agromyces cerinus subsp. cerinus TaxID=232089 RepID=A0A1N6IEP0_9MICO|nr:hypothetical protein [Agromyces cerinus]SIO30507.1 hypothetical protein SAMN05443544_3955 [Agromyces cerinus subsp. cerinus]